MTSRIETYGPYVHAHDVSAQAAPVEPAKVEAPKRVTLYLYPTGELATGWPKPPIAADPDFHVAFHDYLRADIADRAVWLLAHCTDGLHPDIAAFLSEFDVRKDGGE